MDSEGQTVEAFYTTLQIMFYFQKGVIFYDISGFSNYPSE